MSSQTIERNKPEAYIGGVEGTPLGSLWVGVSERGLAAVEVGGSLAQLQRSLRALGFSILTPDQDRVAPILQQIEAYLTGERREFEMPIDWSVLRPFQEQALRATAAIPYGQTRTYAELARLIGRPRAARAVGRAEATNPMPLVIPCHRVLGSDGKLHGYGAGDGLPTKAWLLELEQAST
jgi:O-6-methylguanine DNA methyltransferase